MTEPFLPAPGMWARFERYTLEHGCIRPAPGARLELYDPVKEHRAAEEAEMEPLYVELLALLEAVREEDILAWCARHGPLGILLQRASMIVLAPRWRQPIVTIRAETRAKGARRLQPTLLRYFRTTAGWSSTATQAADVLEDSPDQEGELVAQESVPGTWPRPSAQIQYLRGPGFAQEPLAQTWARFFDVPEDELETYPYPPPLSEEFWRLYAEPIGEFVEGAMALGAALRGLAQTSPRAQLTEERWDAVADGMDMLHGLVRGVGPAVEPLDDGSLRQYWTAPSLLAFAAMTAVEDVTKRRVLSCPLCGRLFFSRDPRTKYCSVSCRQVFQQREFRKRKAEKEGTRHPQEDEVRRIDNGG